VQTVEQESAKFAARPRQAVGDGGHWNREFLGERRVTGRLIQVVTREELEIGSLATRFTQFAKIIERQGKEAADPLTVKRLLGAPIGRGRMLAQFALGGGEIERENGRLTASLPSRRRAALG